MSTMACLQAFLLIIFWTHSCFAFSYDLSSFLPKDSWTSMISQYLGPNPATSTFSDILQSFNSKDPGFVVKTVNKSIGKLQSYGIISGYSATENFINLGVLNVSALNSTLNGKVGSDVLKYVIKKLNSSSYITGVQAVGSDFNLGTINLENVSKIPCSTPVYPTISSYIESNNLTNITARDPPVNPKLIFEGPLKAVTNYNSNLTQNEKISIYKQWYEDTVNALKQNNTNLTLADYRKAFFCYPGISPLNDTKNLTTSLVSCSQLNSTYSSTIQEVNDLFNLIQTPEAAASFLRNGTNLESIKSIILNLRSRLGYLSTILSNTSASDAVNAQTQLVRELIIALPDSSSSQNATTTSFSLTSSLKDYMTKHFQWSSEDFAKLHSELSS